MVENTLKLTILRQNRMLLYLGQYSIPYSGQSLMGHHVHRLSYLMVVLLYWQWRYSATRAPVEVKHTVAVDVKIIGKAKEVFWRKIQHSKDHCARI